MLHENVVATVDKVLTPVLDRYNRAKNRLLLAITNKQIETVRQAAIELYELRHVAAALDEKLYFGFYENVKTVQWQTEKQWHLVGFHKTQDMLQYRRCCDNGAWVIAKQWCKPVVHNFITRRNLPEYQNGWAGVKRTI